MNPFLCFVLFFLVPALALYSSSDDVVLFSSESDFTKRVVNSDEPWLIEFYAPWCGHCKSLAPEWKKAATALKGILNLGAVDMDAHAAIGQPYGIQGFPTLKLFGTNKKSPKDYQGGRTADAIVDFAIQELKTIAKARLSGGGGGGKKKPEKKETGPSVVVELTSATFNQVLQSDDPWMVEFYAPWCGHCKSLAPHWAAASAQLKGKVKLGAVDATVHSDLASKYGIKGYPTIKVFPSGTKGEPLAYEGPRTTDGIVRYGLSLVEESVPAPEVVQLTNSAVFDKQCGGKALCVIAFIPHILDTGAAGRNEYLGTLKALAEKNKRKPFTYVWTEAAAQPELEKVLGIGGFGYPALSVVKVEKKRYATMVRAFTQEAVSEFLGRLFNGQEKTSDFNAASSIIVSQDPWDGKDGVVGSAADEIDLSELYDDLKKDL